MSPVARSPWSVTAPVRTWHSSPGYHLFPTYNHDLNYVALNRFGDDVWNPTLAWFATYLK